MGEYHSDIFFKRLIEYIKEYIQLRKVFPAFKYYDMAGIYAFLGNKEEAYHYLHEFEKRKFFPYRMVNLINRDPLFDSLREEEEFIAIVKNVEEKYLKEHNSVKAWLTVNNLQKKKF